MRLSQDTLQLLSEINDLNASAMLKLQKSLREYKTQIEYNHLLTLHGGLFLRGDKLKLKYTEETLRVVDYHDLDAFITELSGHEYECVSSEEWSNDSCYRIKVDGEVDDYEREYWKKQKAGEDPESTYCLPHIMNCMVEEKLIEPGTYLIRVSW